LNRPSSRGVSVSQILEKQSAIKEKNKVPETVCLNVPTVTDIEDEDEERVYMIADSKFVTQTELLAGLEKVG